MCVERDLSIVLYHQALYEAEWWGRITISYLIDIFVFNQLLALPNTRTHEYRMTNVYTSQTFIKMLQ